MGGIEKQSSKHGKNIGGFLQLFDWNAKSRKKLFPEKSKQKKRCDGNLPVTRVHMLDEDEYVIGSSIKGSDYSCASSVTDEDFHGTKAPGVVARLMGLDSLPRSNSFEPNSTPLFDCRSLPGSCYQSENLEYHREYLHSSSLQSVPFRTEAEPKYQKVIHRPLEKFQTEILPPRSAKAIPVTRNRLLSPIKRGNAIPPENAAHIMEAAARMIDPGPPASVKTKLPLAGSSLMPLKVRDFKEKVQAAQKPAKISEGSQRSSESSAAKQLRAQPINKSWNSPGDAASLRIFHDSEENPSGVKGKGKSISLALQAKANVQRREGLNLNGSSRDVASSKETGEISPNQQPLRSRSLEQKSMLKKSSAHNDSSVLRQNNQKQNSNMDRDKQRSKPKLQGGKVHLQTGDSTSIKQRNSSKLVGTSKTSSRNLGSDVKDDRRQVLPSSSDRATSKKRNIDGNCQTEKNRVADSIRKDKNGKVVHSSDNTMNTPSSWIQETGSMGTDVISFTFTAPITRSGPGSGRYSEPGEQCKVLSSDFRNKRMLLNSHGSSDPNFLLMGNSSEGKDTLSTLLEQKLKELAVTVELSKQKSETGSNDTTVSGLNPSMSSIMEEDNKCINGKHADGLRGKLGSSLCYFRDSKVFITDQKCQIPGPLSVLDHSPFASSCSSSDTAESNNHTEGGKQSLSMQHQDILSGHSINKPTPFEQEVELSDSASSTSAVIEATKEASTLSKGKAVGEMEYVRAILQNIEVMYNKYASGRASKIISPRLFDQLETQKRQVNNSGLACKINRKLMFDCVNEWMELRCRQCAGGGYELWIKGLRMVKRKDQLIKDVYKEICGWSDMGDFMVDELVDSDMSSQYGRWLDFEVEAFELGAHIESRILNSLIDEVVADILVL